MFCNSIPKSFRLYYLFQILHYIFQIKIFALQWICETKINFFEQRSAEYGNFVQRFTITIYFERYYKFFSIKIFALQWICKCKI